MMAAGEARAVWQRTVNRYFVQEDAKRAPKFTSSHSSSTKQVQEDSVSSRQRNQSPCAAFMPLNFSDLLDHHHHLQMKTPLEAEVNITEKKPELGAKSESFQELMETRESYVLTGNDDKSSEKKLLNEIPFDPTSPWNPLSSEKAGPWWRTRDKDELASLVAQRSLDFVENCDLPTPQKMKRCSYYGSPHDHGCKKRTEEAYSESDLSKSELLAALGRSQARAREAEKRAKEACEEKEQLVKLLFKQASELFAYKQWLKLLQLESLYLQIKNKKIEKSNEQTPVFSIPWNSSKGRKEGRKRRSKRNGLFGIAWGMSLVGAGLLLGWTVGWMQLLSF